MLYSKPCEYAIRALANLARRPVTSLVSVTVVADAEDIALPFLARIFHQLARSGVLVSKKGPGGGFQLARPGREIMLREIVEAVDGLEDFERCAVGLARCSDQVPCPLHDTYKELRQRMLGYLGRVSLAEMGAAVERKRILLASGKR